MPSRLRSDTAGNPPRVVVTGGASFNGSNRTRALVAHGDRVVVIDNLATTWSLRLTDDIAERIEFVHGDVPLAEGLRPAADWMHAAGCLGGRPT